MKSYSGHLYFGIKTVTIGVYVFLLEGWYSNNVELSNIVIHNKKFSY